MGYSKSIETPHSTLIFGRATLSTNSAIRSRGHSTWPTNQVRRTKNALSHSTCRKPLFHENRVVLQVRAAFANGQVGLNHRELQPGEFLRPLVRRVPITIRRTKKCFGSLHLHSTRISTSISSGSRSSSAWRMTLSSAVTIKIKEEQKCSGLFYSQPLWNTSDRQLNEAS
jgi:hypothetical protein